MVFTYAIRALAVGIIASIATYIYILKKDLTSSQKLNKEYEKAVTVYNSELNKVIDENSNMKNEFNEYKKQAEKKQAIIINYYKKQIKETYELNTIKEDIKNVKKEDDNIVAPILNNTFKRLQQFQNSRDTKSSNKD